MPPTFSSPDDLIRSISAGLNASSPFLATSTPVPNGAYALWAEKAR